MLHAKFLLKKRNMSAFGYTRLLTKQAHVTYGRGEALLSKRAGGRPTGSSVGALRVPYPTLPEMICFLIFSVMRAVPFALGNNDIMAKSLLNNDAQTEQAVCGTNLA